MEKSCLTAEILERAGGVTVAAEDEQQVVVLRLLTEGDPEGVIVLGVDGDSEASIGDIFGGVGQPIAAGAAPALAAVLFVVIAERESVVGGSVLTQVAVPGVAVVAAAPARLTVQIDIVGEFASPNLNLTGCCGQGHHKGHQEQHRKPPAVSMPLLGGSDAPLNVKTLSGQSTASPDGGLGGDAPLQPLELSA